MQGLIIEKISPRDWIMGANSPMVASKQSLNESANWLPYLPKYEKQKFGVLETMACVSFSANNCLEILYNYNSGEEINWSDRFLAKKSDTTERGNYLNMVAETWRNYGVCLEEQWPYPEEDSNYTWEDYYKNLSNQSLVDAWEYHDKIHHQWVHFDNWKEALKEAPLQVCIKGTYRYKNDDGYIINPTSFQDHAVVLVGYKEGEYWEVFDSYLYPDGQPTKKLAWDYKFYEYAKQFNFNENMENETQIKDSHLYQLVEGVGGFAMGLDGCLIVDDLEKVLASVIMRNKGNLEGKTVCVKQDFWDKAIKKNLKGEAL